MRIGEPGNQSDPADAVGTNASTVDKLGDIVVSDNAPPDGEVPYVFTHI